MTDEGLLIWFGMLAAIGIFLFFGWLKGKSMTEAEKQAQNEQTKQAAEAKYNRTHTTDGQIKCPSCGSTQIQMVSRRWSPLTGFLTNKVDRVCVSCKRRF